jgi:copper chaperone NosL
MHRRTLLLAAFAAPLLGCKEEKDAAVLPAPRGLTQEVAAEFCGMGLLEHPGPKAQVFLRSRPDPLWFASVRDGIAFTMLPETPKDIVVLWVSDMAASRDWERPEAWVAAQKAVFVLGSRRRTGMETDEAVPFGDAEAARRFSAEQGGRLVQLADIPRGYVLGEEDPS